MGKRGKEKDRKKEEQPRAVCIREPGQPESWCWIVCARGVRKHEPRPRSRVVSPSWNTQVVQTQDLQGTRWEVSNFSNTVWEAAIWMHHFFQVRENANLRRKQTTN